MSGELLIYYEVYKGTSKIKTLTSFFIILPGGYHYYFEDLCWKGPLPPIISNERLVFRTFKIWDEEWREVKEILGVES